MEESPQDPVTKRLVEIERENRRWKLVTALALLGLALFAVVQVVTREPIVEAQRFVLRDAGGRLRATLDIDPDNSVKLILRGTDGRATWQAP